ncbi:hypothetical protein BDV3_004532 [Batrachochytrium dendrobatidis]
MALYLRNFLFDSALVPYPLNSAFNYSALCQVAVDIFKLSEPTSRSSFSKYHSNQLSFDIWTDIGQRHLGLTFIQTLVYFETFALILRQSDAMSESAALDGLTAISRVATLPAIIQDSTPQCTPIPKVGPDLNPVSILLSTPVPAIPFLLLLFNQLYLHPHYKDSFHNQCSNPSLQNPINQLHQHMHSTCNPINIAKSNKNTLATFLPFKSLADYLKQQPSDECNNATPSVADSILKKESIPALLSPTKHNTEKNSVFNLQSSLICNESAISKVHFPSHLVKGRLGLSNFWRSSGSQWLALIYLAHKGTQSKNSTAMMIFENQDFSSDCPDFQNFDMDWLSVLDFLFITVSPRQQNITMRLKELFGNWISSKNQNIDNLNDLDPCLTTRTQHDKPSSLESMMGATSTSAFSELFTIMDAKPVIVEFLRRWKGGKKDLADPVSIARMNQFIQWAILDCMPSYRLLKFTRHGIAYGIDDTQYWLQDPHEPPQVLISRKRNQTIVLHSAFISNTAVYIHRCHDTHVYILGPITSLFISECRNTQIIVGAVSKQIGIKQSQGLVVSAVCGQLMVWLMPYNQRFASQTESNHVTAYINTLSRPIVGQGICLNSHSNVGDFKDQHVFKYIKLVLAPCNTYYQGMRDDVLNSGLDISYNMWDKFVQVCDKEPDTKNGVASETTCWKSTPDALQKSNVSLMDPFQYLCMPIPFNRVYKHNSKNSANSFPTDLLASQSIFNQPINQIDQEYKQKTPIWTQNHAVLKKSVSLDPISRIRNNYTLSVLQEQKSIDPKSSIIVDTTYPIVVETSDGSLDRDWLMSVLPQSFKMRLETIHLLVHQVKQTLEILDNHCKHSKDLKDEIASKFNVWLKQTGKFKAILRLMAVDNECQVEK